jgi:large subunit ribosomal protein L17
VLTSKSVTYRLFYDIGPRYKSRSGGYTRIYKLARVRQGDAAAMAVISLLGEQEQIKAPTRPAVVSSPSAS